MICFDECKVDRQALVNFREKKVRLAIISESRQEKDLTSPTNFFGYGRVRHFTRLHENWNKNPLPIDPACKFFGTPEMERIEAQVFQIAQCNFKCWYCFVDEDRLRPDNEFSGWVSIDDMLKFISSQNVNLIDLSGGQPDLVPEWSLWVLRGLRDLHLNERVFVWQDDNLSCNSLRKYLTAGEAEELSSFTNYARVGCFKGFDDSTFRFNTGMPGILYDNQFVIMKELLQLGFDMYAYVTFTTPDIKNLDYRMNNFVERLQKIHPLFPLRTVPLKIINYTPTSLRLSKDKIESFNLQFQVLEKWNEVLQKNYSTAELTANITDIHIR